MNHSASVANNNPAFDAGAAAPANDAQRPHFSTGPHQDLMELAARGAPITEALNAVVRAVAQVRSGETRAAIFILDPEVVKLRFVAAVGLDHGYTSKIDNFAVGPGQPSCGKAAFLGHDVIVADIAADTAWAPFRALADEHGMRACWSFLLKGPQEQVLGSLALYHRVPCEPDAQDYAEVRYFANIASLMIGRHLAAEARTREQAATEENLRADSRHKDVFLATLAHELRNPLGAIKHALTVIQLAGDQADLRERALLGAERQMKQMEWLIEDLLDVNRMTRGQLTLRRQHIDLQPVLDLACETVLPLCEDKGKTLSVIRPAQPVYLDADPVRVTQMIANLLHNACKFTGPAGRIELALVVHGKEVQVRVRDDGIGIAPEQMAHLFTMFSQGSSVPVPGQHGLGIGLALVRGLARMHGGDVEAFSAGSGAGAEFVLRLPMM